MKREIQKYPFYADLDSNKIFLSDKIFDQVIIITNQTGTITYLIHVKIVNGLIIIRNQTNKTIYFIGKKTKKGISVIILAIILWLSQSKDCDAIGTTFVPQKLPIIGVNPTYYGQKVQVASSIPRRSNKLVYVPLKQIMPFIYLNQQNAYINEKLLKKLRAGDLGAGLTIVTIAIVVILTSMPNVDAFSPAFQTALHHSLSGVFGVIDTAVKYNAPTATPSVPQTSTAIAAIPTLQQNFNDMSLEWNEPKAMDRNIVQKGDVMTHNEALALLDQTYTDELQVTQTEKIGDRQVAKHVYHAENFGIDPKAKEYGMTRQQLKDLRRDGLTKYVRKGNPLPPIQLVQDFKKALKDTCKSSSFQRTDADYFGKDGKSRTSNYYNKSTKRVISFNKKTGDLITAHKYSPFDFDQFLFNKQLGSPKWINLWTNN